MSVGLRPLRRADLPAVLVIEEELFAPDTWTEAMLREELRETATRHYLAAVTTEPGSDGPAADGPAADGPATDGTAADEPATGERVVGYGGLIAYPDEGHIATLGVRAAWQGRGIGAQLLDALLTEADRREIPRIILEVRADSPVPQQLYRGRGFQAVGMRKRYYPLSGLDAVVMVRETRSEPAYPR